MKKCNCEICEVKRYKIEQRNEMLELFIFNLGVALVFALLVIIFIQSIK